MTADTPAPVSVRPERSFEKRGLWLGMAGVMAVLLTAGALFVWQTVRQADRDLRHELLADARLVAGAVDLEKVMALSGTAADIKNPAYLDLKKQLAAVHDAHGQTRFIYLLGQQPDGGVFFLADNEPFDSPDLSPPGQPYEEASAALRRVFSTKNGIVEGPASDRWGTWVSALVPLLEPRTGRVMAVLGMDVDARHWQRTVLAAAAWPSVLAAVLVAALAISFALVLARRRAQEHGNELVRSRRQLEQMAAATEQQHRLMASLLDAIPAPVFFKDKNGLYLGCNPAFEAIAGKTEAELLGKRPHEIWPEKFSPTYRDKDLELLQAGGRQQYEYKYAGPDGDERDVIFYKSTFADTNGAVDGLVGVMLDITERKQTEEALRKNEERYRSVLDNIETGYYEVDLAGNLTFFNQSLCDILGYSSDEAMGMNYKEYMDPETAQRVFKIFNQVFETGETHRAFEWPLINKNGEKCHVVTTISLMRDAAGNAIGFRGIERDITEQKQAEAEREKLTAQLIQAQKMESVGRLAGGVAHDFNNMLGVILGYTELALQEMTPADPLYENLKEILSAARHSADITRQLLAFARKQTIHPEIIDLNNTVKSLLKMLHRLIGEDIDLAWRPGSGLWPVNMDPAQINQILANLLVNARDAISGVGEIIIETKNVSLDATDCVDHVGLVPGDYVLLAVSDKGRGMDADTLNRLFEPFFTTKDMGQGTGLGLATVYGIIKQNNGFIYAYSEPGKGTTFKIYLPRHAGTADKSTVPDITAGPPGGDETVLIVEDEASILKLTSRILEKLGYTVLTAAGPTPALKLAEARQGRIHLLVTDVVMPDMNGRDLAEQLQTLHPELKVLYMSGYTADIIGHRGILETGVHFIQKPFSNKDLAIKIRETLGE